MMDERELWRAHDNARAGTSAASNDAGGGGPRGGPVHSDAAAIAVVHNAICKQVHQQWLVHGSVYATSGAEEQQVAVCSAHEPCDPQQCRARCDALTLYVVVPDGDEASGKLDKMRRQKRVDELYLHDETVLLALEGCGAHLPRRSAPEMERRRRAAQQPRASVDLSQFNCLVHACVPRYCLLPPKSSPRNRRLYNLVHQRKLANVPRLERSIYFCARHARFHICDAYCDQTVTARQNDRMCALSARIKSAADNVLAFGDGTLTTQQAEALRETSAAKSGRAGAHEREEYESAQAFARAGNAQTAADTDAAVDKAQQQQQQQQQQQESPHMEAADAPKRRRTTNNDVTMIRDLRAGARGTRGRRGCGRGRGAIAGGSVSERAARARRLLAERLQRSSGDAPETIDVSEYDRRMQRLAITHAAAPEEHASAAVAASAAADASAKKQSARKRKISKAKRARAAANAAPSRVTVRVPLTLLCRAGFVSYVHAASLRRAQSLVKRDADGADVDAVVVKSEPGTHEHAVAVAASQIAAVELPSTVTVDDNDCVLVAFDARAKLPFAERPAGTLDREFAFDLLAESAARVPRFERFRIAALPRELNTFFDNSSLFEHYAERATAIIWRLFESHQRASIELKKVSACRTRIRNDVNAYGGNSVRRGGGRGDRGVGRTVLAEKMDRLAREALDERRIAKRLVMHEELWLVLNTYWALLVVEFYFNLVALPDELVQYLSSETSESIKSKFYFEHFVPLIVKALKLGIVVNNVVILPCDGFVRELYPDSSTLRQLGMPEQTRTHLDTAISSFLSAARASHIPMRRFEATVLELSELAALCVPGVIDGSERMSTSERADAAARRTVQLFLERRLRRLRALGAD